MNAVIKCAALVVLGCVVRAGGLYRAWVLLGAVQGNQHRTKTPANQRRAELFKVNTHAQPHLITVRSERSDISADLVSQHWREAASRWVARRAQGVTLTKRRTNVQSEGASKRVGTSLTLGRGSPERARGDPYQALHECAKAKVQLILKESLAKLGNKAFALDLRKGSLPEGPRQIALSFGLVA